MRARRALAVASLLLLAVACGTEEPGGAAERGGGASSSAPDATDPTGQPQPGQPQPDQPQPDQPQPDQPQPDQPPPDQPAPTEPQVIDLVSVSAAGGRVTSSPRPVGTAQQQASYVAAFAPRAQESLRRTLGTAVPPAGTELTATVVAVGCAQPTEVRVSAEEGGRYRVDAVPAKASRSQCLVPVTTVGLVALPA